MWTVRSCLQGWLWIVDPIDGTTNFAAGQPQRGTHCLRPFIKVAFGSNVMMPTRVTRHVSWSVSVSVCFPFARGLPLSFPFRYPCVLLGVPLSMSLPFCFPIYA